MKHLRTIYILVLLLLVSASVFFVSEKGNDRPPLNVPNPVAKPQVDPKLSTWMWESPTEYSTQEQKELLNEASSGHISTIFLNIEEYVNIKESDVVGAEKAKQLLDYTQSLSSFIRLASDANIRVIALAGDVDWAFDSHRYLPTLLVDFVNEFNLAREENSRFAGIQFDIEYYNSSEYKKANKKEKIKMSTEYLDLVDKLTKRSDIPLGLAIPYWFNRDDSEISFEYGEKKGSIFEHLLNILGMDRTIEDVDAGDLNHLAIMSYRRKTLGNNGTVEIVKGLFKSLQKSNKALTLYIGQDTATHDTAMSFQPNEWNEFIEAVNVLNSTFDEYSSYGGVAVHHLSDYLKMEK